MLSLAAYGWTCTHVHFIQISITHCKKHDIRKDVNTAFTIKSKLTILQSTKQQPLNDKLMTGQLLWE